MAEAAGTGLQRLAPSYGAIGDAVPLRRRRESTLLRASSWSVAYLSKEIGRAPHAQPATVKNVRIDHRRPQVAVPKKLLYRSDVGAGFEEMGGEGVP